MYCVVWVIGGMGGVLCVVWDIGGNGCRGVGGRACLPFIEGMGAEGVGWLVLCCLRMTLKEGWSVWAHRYEEQIKLKAIAPYPDNE